MNTDALLVLLRTERIHQRLSQTSRPSPEGFPPLFPHHDTPQTDGVKAIWDPIDQEGVGCTPIVSLKLGVYPSSNYC